MTQIQENSLKKLQHFDIFKVILASIAIASFLLSFVSLIVAVAPHVLYPYTPYDSTQSFSIFTSLLFMFILAFCAGSLVGALIKKIKWRWAFIWFFSAVFLAIGKESALFLITKFREDFNYMTIALYALAILMISLYLIKRRFSEKTTALKSSDKLSLFKRVLIYGSFVFLIFWLIVLLSVYGSWNVKYNVSQTAIIFLAITLPFTASAFIETAVKDKKLKPFLIFGALSLLFLALAALLSVPIDSPYDIN